MSEKWVEKESRMLSSKSKLVKFETLQALCQHVEPCIIALTFLVRKKYKCHRNEHTRGHLDRNYESLSPRYWSDSKSSITCSLLARYFKWELVVISTILLPSSRTWSPFTTSQVSHFLGICRNVFPPFLLQGWLNVSEGWEGGKKQKFFLWFHILSDRISNFLVDLIDTARGILT